MWGSRSGHGRDYTWRRWTQPLGRGRVITGLGRRLRAALVVSNSQTTPLLAPVSVALLVVRVVVSNRGRRRARLKRFRSEWGRGSTQERDFAAIALYHRTMQTGETASGLDERTATDLDLDAVFEILDHTETTVGQQLLYQRLRSSFTRNELSAFEAANLMLLLDVSVLYFAAKEIRAHGPALLRTNMSGKSTFLRTLGVNAVLAQTLNTCLASAYEAPVFTIRSVIGRGDDLVSGISYYKDEVEAVLAIVRLCEDHRPSSSCSMSCSGASARPNGSPRRKRC